jgi:hypothetical protein
MVQPSPTPCIDVPGSVQTVCVAQPLAPAVTTPGVNLRGLRADPADVQRLGVEIYVSQSDLISPPEPVKRLHKACWGTVCGYAAPARCEPGGLSCSYRAVIAPSRPATDAVGLQLVELKAADPSVLHSVEQRVWLFAGLPGEGWTYWSLAEIERGEPPHGLVLPETR